MTDENIIDVNEACAARSIPLTKSQLALVGRITDFGKIHFDPSSWGSPLTPHTNLLVSGPTGTGKSFTIREAAKRLGARYYDLNYGTWVPVGAYGIN